MSSGLNDLTARLQTVSDLYAKRTGVRREGEWQILKLQEELGELVAEHLRLRGGKRGDASTAETHTAVANEAADLLAHVLLYASSAGIDIEAALQRKWLHYLPDADEQ